MTGGYENLGGYLTSSPGATAHPNTAVSKIDVFARGGSGDFSSLWQKACDPSVYPSGGWSDWTSLTFP
jgi:hypothetical protein